MTPNERPTPEKESENNYFNDTPRVNALIIELRKPCDGDRMDMISLARTLERSLAERTEELDALKKAISQGTRLDYVVSSYDAMASALIAERDTALAKTIAAACCEKCGRELVDDKCEKCEAKREEEFEKQ